MFDIRSMPVGVEGTPSVKCNPVRNVQDDGGCFSFGHYFEAARGGRISNAVFDAVSTSRQIAAGTHFHFELGI